MKRTAASLVLAVACCGPQPTSTRRPPSPAPPLGRAASALVCPAGTTAFEVPASACSGRIFDYPTPRLCYPREHEICAHRFGTSEGGRVTVCRTAEGKDDGPIEVRERDGSVVADATCRRGTLWGVLVENT